MGIKKIWRRRGDESSAASSQLERIYQEESASLEAQWRRTHLHTMFLLSILTVAVEIAISAVLQYNNLITIPRLQYAAKYIGIPLLTYCSIDLVTVVLYHFSHLSGKAMNYVVSLSFALLSGAISMFHSYFVVVYTSGAAVIALTTLYGDRKLTAITALTTILLHLALAFLTNWDPLLVRNDTFFINICLAAVIELSVYLISSMIVRWEARRRQAVVLRQAELEELRQVAVRDPLTGMRNRLGLRQHIDDADGELLYAMADIDHFKTVNDHWGHAVGDQVLTMLGNIFLSMESDRIAAFRYGGDEFLLLFSACTGEEARAICHEAARIFSASLTPQMRAAGVGLCFGVSTQDAAASPSEAICRADQALYHAKHDEP
ncbi:MAG: diguanylate cyclase [Eubacteriales bacterium]|nr:diguanylate cyclase [Eubacteriales bacterium]